jgi:uncharacterized membrane protein SpoIIM required for sporulation
MIIDVARFIEREKPCWQELEVLLGRLEADSNYKLNFSEARRFYYLYQRASADLGQVSTFSVEISTRHYLESLVARAYGEIHEVRSAKIKIRLIHWFLCLFPIVFRRHARAFSLSLGITVVGILFGAGALIVSPDTKSVLLPFEHLQGRPSERVAWEEQNRGQHLEGNKAQFSTMLMTHNIRVSILVLALTMTYGLGTATMLFYNGVILGAVAADYIADGQTAFLCGWLLPHGTIEIPAILVAGQAAFVLARALIGTGESLPLQARLRKAGPDVVVLVFGFSVMLVWAGFMESFFSQYHEPVMPYALKIAIGLIELAGLILLLRRGGLNYRGEDAQ